MADIRQSAERAMRSAGDFLRALDRRTGRVPSLLLDAVRSHIEHQGTQSAASIAYYALVSIFPLVLFLVLAAGTWLRQPEVQQRIFDFLSEQVPVSLDIVRQVVNESLRYRGSLGIVAALTLLWTSSGLFANLEQGIQRAWELASRRPFWRGRLVGILMVVLLAVGLLLSVASASIVGLVQETLLGLIPFDFIQRLAATLMPLALLFPVFYLLYQLVPYTRVRPRYALAGALFATVGWFAAKEAFSFYLSSNPARYVALYGSLGTLIAFLLWVYISAHVLLLGAEVAAAMHRRDQGRERGKAPFDNPA